MATQDDYIKTALRLPRDLHAELTSSAQLLGRSLNAEIIERLARGTNTWEMHKVISQLTQAIEDGNNRRKRENGAILRGLDAAVEALRTAVDIAEREGVSGDALDDLRNSFSEQESNKYQFEALIDHDAEYLGDV
ncbi:Arc family DNA-binding protein [Paraburkholderia sp. D1E]|uniref:Arc family DNA-binding protein n=1 Tax=Paraburkholderia sp. D1E TaxID=3461398 RepID=UPI0040466FF8